MLPNAFYQIHDFGAAVSLKILKIELALNLNLK